MTEGEAIGDPEVLARLAADAGLDGSDVRAVLANDAYAREVRADEREAQALRVTGVPFFVFGQRYALSGAQPAQVHLGALEQAWRDISGAPTLTDGAGRGPDGCA